MEKNQTSCAATRTFETFLFIVWFFISLFVFVPVISSVFYINGPFGDLQNPFSWDTKAIGMALLTAMMLATILTAIAKPGGRRREIAVPAVLLMVGIFIFLLPFLFLPLSPWQMSEAAFDRFMRGCLIFGFVFIVGSFVSVLFAKAGKLLRGRI